jgi:hypothetical protein
MLVIRTSRSHRIAYLTLFLVVAVTLTTALMLAAERCSPATLQNSEPIAARALTARGAQDVH